MFFENWGNKSQCCFFGRQPHFELNIADLEFAMFWKPHAWLGVLWWIFWILATISVSFWTFEKQYLWQMFWSPHLWKSYVLVQGVPKLKAIMGWAKSHLSLGGGETKYDTMIIPYHGEAHWSLLVLELSHTFHYDSKIGVHDYLTCDIFIQQVCGALMLLWGVHLGDPTFNELVEKPVLNVPILIQVGSWECGYATSHNLCQYLVYKACL